MIGADTLKYIECAVDAEVEYGNKLHGAFHNHHEAYSVNREELEEMMDCFDPLSMLIKSKLELLWDLVKADEMTDELARYHINLILEKTMELEQECVQVMAMCRKWNNLIDKENEV